ncbi:hypothetical protein [Streptomyces sp. NPDC045369]|uniref:Lsr2 family DNA-binding protein n=1 Tax=Streptomyces sp. NPDC045369 TaxID=3155732 RepID=UPI003404FEF8
MKDINERQEAVLRFLRSQGDPVRASKLVGATRATSRDLLDLEERGVILSHVERVGEGRPVKLYRLPYAPISPERARAHVIAKGLTHAADTGPVTPAEYRLYDSWQRHEARMAEVRAATEERRAREAQEAMTREANRWTPGKERRWAREWGRANGWAVGTRGRVSAALLAAYREDNARTKVHPQAPATAGSSTPAT